MSLKNILPIYSLNYYLKLFLEDLKCFGVYSHRRLLLKLDTKPFSHLVVEVCIQQGMCIAPQPLKHGT